MHAKSIINLIIVIFLPEKSMQFVLVWLVLIRIESIKVHVIVRAIVHIESATNLRLICQWMYLKNQNSDLINGIKRNSMKNWSYLWNERISFGIKSQNAEADIHSDDKYKTKLKLPCVTWCYSVHKIDRLPFVPSNVMLFIGFFGLPSKWTLKPIIFQHVIDVWEFYILIQVDILMVITTKIKIDTWKSGIFYECYSPWCGKNHFWFYCSLFLFLLVIKHCSIHWNVPFSSRNGNVLKLLFGRLYSENNVAKEIILSGVWPKWMKT